MLFVALIQKSNKLECLFFELCIYFFIRFLIKIIIKPNKNKIEKKKYKYENFDENISENKDYENEMSHEYIEQMVSEAKDKISERKARIDSYDYREFKGRKNVDWNEVYEYLWFHCRYKGIRMWNEYIGKLIDEGCINEIDKKEIFKKAGRYISFNPRLELERMDEIEDEKVRKRDKYCDSVIDQANKYFEKLYKMGVISKETYEKSVKKCDESDRHLKMFNYDEYLKRKGYI